jgi:LAS superfamily LD-carboxypeptidase LdcB
MELIHKYATIRLMEHRPSLFKKILVALGVTILIVLIGFSYWYFYNENKNLAEKNTELEEALKNSNDSLTRVTDEKKQLTEALAAAGDRNKAFADQLNSVNNTIERYQRLSQLDPELLQKYSKVYFLNENYTPSALTDIDTKYLSAKNRPLEIHDRVWPFLKNMLDNAAQDGITIQIASAYRSFGTQTQLKSSYKVTYGAGTANSFSADQGYSEHQLGTAIDLTTVAVGGSLTGFEKTTAYTWLKDNAYKYGFILSYPANNKFYVFEPWHWRFVGLDLALKLRTEDKSFYDLDQRDISPFLINIFSNAPSQPTLP